MTNSLSKVRVKYSRISFVLMPTSLFGVGRHVVVTQCLFRPVINKSNRKQTHIKDLQFVKASIHKTFTYSLLETNVQLLLVYYSHDVLHIDALLLRVVPSVINKI